MNKKYIQQIAELSPNCADVNAPIKIAKEAVKEGCDHKVLVSFSKQSMYRDMISGIPRLQIMILTARDEYNALLND